MLKQRYVLTSALLALLLVWTVPGVQAGGGHDHMKDTKGMQHEGHGGPGHDMPHGHGSGGQDQGMHHGSGMVMVGQKTKGGVKAMLHLKDAREQMAKMGMKTTHHLMVMLTDTTSGTAIESGTVTTTIKTPSGREVRGLEMAGMQGHFGKDVTLTEPGTYEFTVDLVLADGRSRTFRFSHRVQ